MNRWTYTPCSMEDADAADGKAIVEWLKDNGCLRYLIYRGPSVDRRIRAWRAGEIPAFYTVDQVLANFDIHPSELPDDVWLARVSKRALETA